MSETQRQFDNNNSYVDGRAVELFVDKWLQKYGMITISTRGSKNSYDLRVIDPGNFESGEFLLQIKSSKKLAPYITCKHLNWLLKDAEIMNCIPLICFCYTISKQFYIFDPRDHKIYFTNIEGLSKNGSVVYKFKCLNKQK